MKRIFYVLLAFWLGGAALGQLLGVRLVHEISVNVFGLLALATGAFLLLRWGVKKSRSLQRAGASSAGTSEPLAAPIESTTGDGVGVSWSRWRWVGDELTADYDYRGPSMDAGQSLRIAVTVEPGMSGVLRMPNIFLVPALVDEPALGRIMVTSLGAGTATGPITVRTAPVPKDGRPAGATLLNFPERAGADQFVAMLLGGEDFRLDVWVASDQLAALPVTNDGGFRRLYEERPAALRVG